MSLLGSQPASVEQIQSDLARVSVAKVMSGAHTVTFQPSRRPEDRIEDRHLVEDWELANGTWKFIGVFDGARVARVYNFWHDADPDSELGHGAGHEAVDFVVEALPGMIKASIESAFGATKAITDSTIEEILVQCISGIDDRIKADFVNFFPGGISQISKLTDDEIKNTIADPETGNSYVQIMRARTGTTALVALIDPLKSLHVASLGDCEAILAAQNSVGVWETKVLSRRHNARNKVEADRVREEHPGEEEVIHQGRTLGLITLTRAIGDISFKLPPIYTERVLALATPPFHKNYRVSELLDINLTPPYISNCAEVEHVDLSSLGSMATPVLVLCSDGLVDLYSRYSKVEDIAQAVQLWITALTFERDNLALDLLWDALGGDKGVEVSSKIVRGMSKGRVDDTTVVVLSQL